jgi:probable F420-dependent oxidoreductase
MKVDAGIQAGGMAEVPARVRALEAAGYDGAVSAEINADPFLPLVLAAEHSERIELLTSIAVAFARNPMNLAYLAHDLNAFSGGRFILGLGSQVQAHVTKRFGMPWSEPAARMRELILALRAIWACWYQGEPLAFRGRFYTHTLMTPMFTPARREGPPPRVFLAAVGPHMAEVAGEVADGLIAHGFTTPRYLREVTLPALERGLARSGRSRGEVALCCPVFVATGADERAQAAAARHLRGQIAFYGSTPAYRPVLESSGRGDLHPELHRLSKQGRWEEMGGLVDDALLREFAVVAEPARVAEEIERRLGGLADRLFCTFELPDPQLQAACVARLQAAGPAARR